MIKDGNSKVKIDVIRTIQVKIYVAKVAEKKIIIKTVVMLLRSTQNKLLTEWFMKGWSTADILTMMLNKIITSY